MKSVQKLNSNIYQNQTLISETYSLFQQLFQVRLIQKLASPISMKKKYDYLHNYKQKFAQLHTQLDRIKNETCKQSESVQSNKLKSMNSNVQVKQKNFKKDIYKIQTKYNELFVEGSFKYYEKVAKLYGLPLNLFLINIEQWVIACLGNEDKGNHNCCC